MQHHRQLSQADHGAQPPLVTIPRRYNAAHDLLARNAAWPDKTAFINAISGEKLSYGELTRQAHQFANALRAQGFAPESRLLIAMLDTPDWPVVFLGCILAGVVPVAANTLLTTADFDFMLRDSRAQGLVVSDALLPAFEPLFGQTDSLKMVFVDGEAKIADFAFVMPWEAITWALIITILVTICSGLIPAIKASKLDPIEALRYE